MAGHPWVVRPSSNEFSRSHSDTPHLVGLLWTSDRTVAKMSTVQHTTLIRYRHPCPRRDSKHHSQQDSWRRPTPQTERPLGSVKSNLLRAGAKVTACLMSRNKQNCNNGTSVMTLAVLLFLENDKTFSCILSKTLKVRFIVMIYLLTAIGLSPGGSTHLHTNNTQNNTNKRTTQINEKHKYKLMWKSGGRAPSLRVLPWHLPYN